MRRPMTAQTRENKARRAQTRSNRLEAAHNRRFSDTWIDPVTGKKATKFQMREHFSRRHAQAMQVSKKRDQRRTFSRLSPTEKARHRAAAPDGARTKPVRDRPIERQWTTKGPSTRIDLTNILTG